MLGRSPVLAALAALLVSFATHATDSYPTRPILLVVPFSPGGLVELVGRPLGAAMAKLSTPIQYLDQPEFQRFFAADAKRLAEAVRKIGRVEEKK